MLRSKSRWIVSATLLLLLSQFHISQAQASLPSFTSAGLVLQYDMNNSSTYSGTGSIIYDLTSNHINATESGTVLPSYSAANGGYETITGTSSQYIYTDTITATGFDMTSAYSTFMWVKPLDNGIILDERGLPKGANGWQDANIEYYNNNLYFETWNNPQSNVQSSIQPGFGNWIYVGFTYTPNTVTGYVNGSSAGTLTRTAANMPVNNLTYKLFYTIGQKDATSLGNAYGNFLFGSLHVYNAALTSSQILDNYNALKSRFNPPTITSFSPSTGPTGTTVTLTGTNMFGTTAVNFNGIPAATFTVLSDTQTTAVVPNGSASGKISLTSGGNTATSLTDYNSFVGPATANISLTAGGTTTSKNKSTSLTVSLNTPGTVTFYANGRVINRCQSIVTATTSATCNWLPLSTTRVPITVYVSPNSTSYSASLSSPFYVQVTKRSTPR